MFEDCELSCQAAHAGMISSRLQQHVFSCYRIMVDGCRPDKSKLYAVNTTERLTYRLHVNSHTHKHTWPVIAVQSHLG